MTNDAQCLGMCMIDPDTGACMGCGRLPEEIHGVPVAPPVPEKAEFDYRLPDNIQAEVGQGSD
jgi:hypothetical protein